MSWVLNYLHEHFNVVDRQYLGMETVNGGTAQPRQITDERTKRTARKLDAEIRAELNEQQRTIWLRQRAAIADVTDG